MQNMPAGMQVAELFYHFVILRIACHYFGGSFFLFELVLTGCFAG
jgi:hypothetical protein